MPKKLMFDGHPATTPQPYDQDLGLDHARVAPMQSDGRPNRLRRMVPAGVALAGVVAVMLGTGIDRGARSIAEDVWNLVNGVDTYGMLQHPYPEVNAEVKSGAIDSADVTRVTVRKPESAFGEALILTAGDHNPNPVSDTIKAQQGDLVNPGDRLILQAGSIDPQTPQK